MNIFNVKNIKEMLPRVFQLAVDSIHVLPVFKDAAGEGDEDSGGLKCDMAFRAQGNLPGMPDGVRGEGANNAVLKGMKSSGAQFSQDQYNTYHIK